MLTNLLVLLNLENCFAEPNFESGVRWLLPLMWLKLDSDNNYLYWFCKDVWAFELNWNVHANCGWFQYYEMFEIAVKSKAVSCITKL